ncbi:MAG: O-antigen ligase family protein [Nitrospiraceae bacterium]
MSLPFVDHVRRYATVGAGWAAVALGVTIPVSTTADGVVLVIFLLAWMSCGSVGDRLRTALRHPAALACLAFFLLLMVGALYGDSSLKERLTVLRRYDDFLIPVFLLPIFAAPQVRERALWAFSLAMGLALVLSFLLAAGFIADRDGGWVQGYQQDASAFKGRITHSLFMSFAALLLALKAGRQPEMWKRIGLWSLTVLAIIDVVLLVQSQTGQVVLLALFIYWCWRRLGMKGLAVGVCVGAIILFVTFQTSTTFRDRIAMVFEQIRFGQSERIASNSQPVAVALRLEWYKNSLDLVVANPIAGVGTGGFAKAYAAAVTDPTAIKPAHPHNQYLLTSVELGVPGLMGLLALFGWLWWLTCQIPESFYKELGQGALVLMTVGCLFNSLLLDHAEGLFFVWIMCIAFAGIRTSLRVATC